MLCPRCGDVFADAFTGVSACVRCGGVWLSQPTIDRAFGEPIWPAGSNLWWRRELHCPVCASQGTVTVMNAILDGNVLVDRCRGHGVWLDDGELGRILDANGNGLAELYARVHGVDMQPDVLRRLTQTELAQKRMQAAESKVWLERMKSEAQRAADDARKRRQGAVLGEAKQNVERLEEKLVRIRHELRTCENELAAARVLVHELENEPPST
jgi:Zn-finger nucleic acid-binding protein